MDTEKPIIFFDGVCNLCNGFVDYVVRSDRQQKLYIASLQGERAAQLLSPKDRDRLHSVVLWTPHRLYYRSAAIFQIAKILKGPLLLLLPFSIFPKFITDFFYDWVARSRYTLFGKRNSCRIPSEEEKKHFLE
ncbi:MAG: DUF393 domain-containing protein [Bdellovibrionales bacterium]|nr:DUF393 domain-containing protein [Bdellovibrionales bacterium]